MSARTKVIKEKEGPNGKYDYVESDKGWPNSTLTCKNPGNINCQWSATQYIAGNGGDVDCDEIVAWVENMVYNGGYTTGTDVDYGTTGIRVTWTYDSVEEQLIVDILDINE